MTMNYYDYDYGHICCMSMYENDSQTNLIYTIYMYADLIYWNHVYKQNADI